MTRTKTFKRFGQNIVEPYKARASKPAGTPLADFVIGTWVGGVLEHLGMRALKRGELHEFNHITAALYIGNSDHTDGAPCHLPSDRLLGRDEPIVFTPRGIRTPTNKT